MRTKSVWSLKLNIILLSLFIGQYLSSTCTSGCLSCEKIGFEDAKCTLCDSVSGFYMERGRCIKSKHHGCTLITFEGECHTCEEKHYFDFAIQSCKLVPNSNVIEFCQYYKSLNSCLACHPGYYYSSTDGACLKVDTLIDQCEYYYTATECMRCVSDYWPAYDKKTCYPIDGENCLVANVLRCGYCNDNYFHSQNYALTNLGQSIAQIMMAKYLNFDFIPFISIQQSTCVRKSDENCDVFIDATTCKTCKAGYFLYDLDNRCYELPTTSILNCKYFGTLTTCNECEVGYHLASSSSCVQNEVLDNCLTYASDKPSTFCSLCEEGFFVNQGTGACNERVNSKAITFCEKYADFLDECIECVYGYTLTNDNLKCLKQVDGCQEYATSNKETKEFTCYICNEGYYLDETTKNCIQPADYFSSRCKKYKRDSSQCEECTKNTFVKTISTCEAHDQNVVTPNCVDLSLLDRNMCDVCDEGYFLFPSDSNCLPLTNLIQNCVVYLDEENCQECLIGYYGSQCTRIPSEKHCLTVDSNDKCTKCENDYLLDTNTNYQDKCVKPPAIIEDYCNDITVTNGSFLCQSCKENMLSMNYKYSSYCDTPEDDIPEFCVKMGIRNSKVTCINCEPGYYLKDQTCVRQCNFANYVIKMQRIKIVSNRIINYGERSCVQSANDLCLVKTYAITNTSKALQEICARCKDDASPVIDGTNFRQAHVLNIEYSIIAENHPMIRAPALTCVQNDTLFAAIHAGTATEHCKYFRKNDAEYVCQRCINGYSGKLKHVVDLSSGITACTTKIPYCNTEVNFKGANYKAELTTILEGMYSCSSCEGDRIPFFHGRRISPGEFNLKAYDYSGGNDPPFTESLDPSGEAVACLNPNDPSDFGLTSPITTFTRSCGLGMVNVLASKANPSFLICLACLPGFKATYDSTDKDFVTNCEKIENCDTSYGYQWFNACSKCTGGFIFDFNPTNNTIQYDKCIQKDSDKHKNCIAGVEDSFCHVCEEGYTLNEDLICEFISSFDCSSNFTNNDYQEGTFGASNDQYDFTLPLVYNFNGKGCEKCETNSRVAIEVGNNDKYFCTPRTYIAFNSFISGSSFIDNCLRYQGEDNTFDCIQCREEFLINGSSSVITGLTLNDCFAYNDNLLYCEVANKFNSSECIKCKENYLLNSSGKCITSSLNNCEETGIFFGVSIGCTRCRDGYFLNSSKLCELGTVANCKTFLGTKTNCIECIDGYRIFSDSSSNDYCIKMQDTRCKKWNATAAAAGKFDCEICEDGFSPSKNRNRVDFRPNMCLGPIIIPNCVKYDIDQKSVTTSTFTCHTCKEGYYRDGGICTARQKLDVNCISYDRQNDECTECHKDYVINNDSTACLTNPTGVANCASYKDLNTCKTCNNNFYLVDNVCVSVPPSSIQNGCLEYKSETECAICDTAYYLSNTFSCRPSTATNCLEFKNQDECTSCVDGYFLTQIPNQIQDGRETLDVCQQEQVVPNCIEQGKKLTIDNTYEYFCRQCAENYYLGESGCELVSPLIPDCMFYSSSTNCLYCIPGKVTTVDKRSCINSYYVVQTGADVDQNCKQNRISKAPICNLCKPGYTNIAAKCVKCDIGPDCLTCDPNDVTKCIVCKPGHYMDADKKCHENVEEEDDDHDHKITATDGNETDLSSNTLEDVGESALVYRIVWLLLGVLVVYAN